LIQLEDITMIKLIASTVQFKTRGDVGDYICHGCDGPITRFVLISRATEAVSKGASANDAAEELYEALLAYGFMSPDQVD
jgi:hypothetical protein